MIRIFKNLEEYNTFTNNGQDLVSGDLYWVKENKRAFFLTNNIDGEVKSYDMFDEIPEEYIVPSGNIAITENGEGIDVTQYASASVNVPIPEGYIQPSGNKEITANGTNIDVNNYATASVNVPIPDGYIQPSGNISITENGENIDVTNYATASVNVASTGGTGTEDLRDLIEGDITTLNIPEGTTSIKDYTFNNCTNLTDVTIPETVKSIGSYAFVLCQNLKNVNIPESVETIGERAFNGCRSLKSVNIPNNVTIINDYTFYNCSGLTSVTLGNALIGICQFAFFGCTSLKSITITTITPPQLLTAAIDPPKDCKILVPAESVSAYRAATNWTEYADRIFGIGEVATGPDDFEHGVGGGVGDTDVPIE